MRCEPHLKPLSHPNGRRYSPVAVGQTMETWPAKQPSDVCCVYLSIRGDVYSEAVTVVVMREADALRSAPSSLAAPDADGRGDRSEGECRCRFT